MDLDDSGRLLCLHDKLAMHKDNFTSHNRAACGAQCAHLAVLVVVVAALVALECLGRGQVLLAWVFECCHK